MIEPGISKKNLCGLFITQAYSFPPRPAVEYCGVKTRTYPLVAVMAAYTTASLAIPLLAKILPAWRSLKMIAVFPNLLVIAAHFLGWIPESLSWLLCKNKVEEAQSTIHSVARINGVDLKVGSSDSKTSNLSLSYHFPLTSKK